MSTQERQTALEAIFNAAPSGLGRTAGDAAVLAFEALAPVEAALYGGVELGDADITVQDRHEVDAVLYPGALNAGEVCLDVMRGLVIAQETAPEVMAPRLQDAAFVPIDKPWRESGSSYGSALAILKDIHAKIKQSREQPNQLFRFLAEAVAFSADLAGWSSCIGLEQD